MYVCMYVYKIFFSLAKTCLVSAFIIYFQNTNSYRNNLSKIAKKS